MKSRRVLQARQNLCTPPPRAGSGAREVVTFPPGKAHFEDYTLHEYGMTGAELGRAEVKIGKHLAREQAREWDGTSEGLRT